MIVLAHGLITLTHGDVQRLAFCCFLSYVLISHDRTSLVRLGLGPGLVRRTPAGAVSLLLVALWDRRTTPAIHEVLQGLA